MPRKRRLVAQSSKDPTAMPVADRQGARLLPGDNNSPRIGDTVKQGTPMYNRNRRSTNTSQVPNLPLVSIPVYVPEPGVGKLPPPPSVPSGSVNPNSNVQNQPRRKRTRTVEGPVTAREVQEAREYLQSITGSPTTDITNTTSSADPSRSAVTTNRIKKDSEVGRRLIREAEANEKKFGDYIDNASRAAAHRQEAYVFRRPVGDLASTYVFYEATTIRGREIIIYPRITLEVNRPTVQVEEEEQGPIPIDDPQTPVNQDAPYRTGEFYWSKGPLWSGRKVVPRGMK